MLTPPPVKYPRRRRRRIRQQNAQPAPIPGPILTAATFDPGSFFLTLTFDRAIDVSGLNGNVIVVDDGIITLQRFKATGTVEQFSPELVRLGLNAVGASTIEATALIATVGNGIVSASDGGPWAGANVDLPF